MAKKSKAMFRLLQADGNISINKNLIHAIGLNESIIYCELLSRHSYFDDRNKLQDDGSFFNTIYDLEFGTGLGEKAQRTAIKNLEKLGLLKCKVKGVPARRYFYINFDADIEDFIELGERKLEELKKLLSEKPVKSIVPPKAETSSAESSNKNLQEHELDTAEGYGNNTKNKTKNNTNLIILNKEGVVQTERWEGLPNGKTQSIPFPSFLVQDIKNYKTSYRVEIVETILYYYGQYYEKFGVEHFRYTEKQLKDIYSRLDYIFSVGVNDDDTNRLICLDADTIKEVIDQHFNTNYSGNMSWTLLSFLNDNVLKNRCYEVGCV